MSVIPLRRNSEDKIERIPTQGRLAARPQSRRPILSGVLNRSARELPTFGLQPLTLGERRDGFLYIPSGYQHSQPAPLIVMLHGAGGNGQHGLAPLLNFSDETGVILVAPDSRGRTWDFIVNEYGPDVDFIDEALEVLFDRYAIDSSHVGIGGFSDGASYALSLGIANGDLFTHILAYSPGFMAPPLQYGAPKIYITHGTGDQVLLIDHCGRKIAKRIHEAGYDVTFREFDDGHGIPLGIAREGLDWFMI